MSGNADGTSFSTSGSRSPHAVASMASKNKYRKKSKASSKVTFQPEENDMEAENSGGEEDEDPARDGGEDRGKKEEEEFSLDEVLRLGGTQVIKPLHRQNCSSLLLTNSGGKYMYSSSVTVLKYTFHILEHFPFLPLSTSNVTQLHLRLTLRYKLRYNVGLCKTYKHYKICVSK